MSLYQGPGNNLDFCLITTGINVDPNHGGQAEAYYEHIKRVLNQKASILYENPDIQEATSRNVSDFLEAYSAQPRTAFQILFGFAEHNNGWVGDALQITKALDTASLPAFMYPETPALSLDWEISKASGFKLFRNTVIGNTNVWEEVETFYYSNRQPTIQDGNSGDVWLTNVGGKLILYYKPAFEWKSLSDFLQTLTPAGTLYIQDTDPGNSVNSWWLDTTGLTIKRYNPDSITWGSALNLSVQSSPPATSQLWVNPSDGRLTVYTYTNNTWRLEALTGYSVLQKSSLSTFIGETGNNNFTIDCGDQALQGGPLEGQGGTTLEIRKNGSTIASMVDCLNIQGQDLIVEQDVDCVNIRHEEFTTLTSQGSAPAVVPSAGRLFSQIVNGRTELFYRDDRGIVTQLTSTFEKNPANVTRLYVGGFGPDEIRVGDNFGRSFSYANWPFQAFTSAVEGVAIDSEKSVIGVGSSYPVPIGIKFDNTGSRMFLLALSTGNLYQYNVGTPFDITSVSSLPSQTFDLSSTVNDPTSIAFDASGSRLYVLDGSSGDLYQWSLSTVFQINTATTSPIIFNTGISNVTAIEWNNTGTQFYIGTSSQEIATFSVGTAYVVNTASSIPINTTTFSFSVDDFELSNNGQKVFFLQRPDNAISEYNLSNPFDLSALGFNGFINVSSEITAPLSFTFSDTGSEFFIGGQTVSEIFQYNLGTAFSLNSASYSGNSFNTENLDLGTVIKIDTFGNEIWRDANWDDNVLSTTVDTNDNIYASSFDGQLKKYSPNGEVLWTFNAPSGAFLTKVRLDLQDGVYVGQGNPPAVRKIDAITGSQIWEYTGPTNAVRAVGVDGGLNVYTGNDDGFMIKLDPGGNFIYSVNITNAGGGIFDIETDNNADVLVASFDDFVRKYDPDGNEIWAFTDGDPKLALAIDEQGNVYVGGFSANVNKINDCGNIVWSWPHGMGGVSSITLLGCGTK
jgi:hypothetical protein